MHIRNATVVEAMGGSTELPAPKKAKLITSAEKVRASVSCDVKGIPLIGYLAKDNTIAPYYSNPLDQLYDEL